MSDFLEPPMELQGLMTLEVISLAYMQAYQDIRDQIILGGEPSTIKDMSRLWTRRINNEIITNREFVRTFIPVCPRTVLLAIYDRMDSPRASGPKQMAWLLKTTMRLQRRIQTEMILPILRIDPTSISSTAMIDRLLEIKNRGRERCIAAGAMDLKD